MICLTFDTDHMSETRMREFLDVVPILGAGTFFCTQRYACLEATGHETAPHPTLEPGTDWDAELAAQRRRFPNAAGWRAHSCLFSHRLALELGRLGYTYASSHDEFGRAHPAPHRLAWGLWHMPVYYADNIDFSTPRFWPQLEWEPFAPELIETAVQDSDGVYVFDFHPIHLLLNTPSAEYYLERRDAFLARAPLEQLRFGEYGTHVFYDDLVAAMGRNDLLSLRMREALELFTLLSPGDLPAGQSPSHAARDAG
jgi:hypothetical protein